MRYYTVVIALTVLTFMILGILSVENNRFSNRDKRLRCINCGLFILAAVSEWLAFNLNGNTSISPFLIRIVKFGDFFFTPTAGALIALRYNKNDGIIKFVNYILIFNSIFQIISLFTNWMITIDSNNFYHNATLFPIYLVICALILIFIIIGFATYSKNFRKRNRSSLYAIFILLIIGIPVQEILTDVKTAFITIAIGMCLIYIHNAEFSSLTADDMIQEQTYLIAYDPLTQIYSRNEYTLALNELNKVEKLPDDFVVFSMDVNGLKLANDTYGHEGGDEIICAAAHCIDNVFGKYGKCYRTGGDEFIVLANVAVYDIPKLLKQLDEDVENWKGEIVPKLSLSVGRARAIEFPGLSVEKLIIKSDESMYKSKSHYYQTAGIERREN